MRDATCRTVVMMFVHHLSEAARTRVLQHPSFRLPLLPSSVASDFDLTWESAGEKEQAVLSFYENASLCSPCHLDASESPSPPPIHVTACSDGVMCEPGHVCCCNGPSIGYCVPEGPVFPSPQMVCTKWWFDKPDTAAT